MTARRVLIVEDDARLRAVLATLLPTTLAVTIVGSAREALAQLEQLDPEVAVVDLGLPDLDGVDLIAELRRRRPALPVLVLTVASSEARVLAALRAGACGYLFKEDLVVRLADAIDEVLAGGVPMSRGVAHLLLSQLRGDPAVSGPIGPQAATSDEPVLSRRQLDVLELLARGLRYADVAEALGVSVDTVRTHVRAIYEKLEVTSKTEAVVTAVRLGLVRRE